MRHAYDMLLRLYPEPFRRRYGAEMSLDFTDGWAEARATGPAAVLRFACRVAGDLAVSLLREWTRGARLVIVAATAGVTLLLWGLALRPWVWLRGHPARSATERAEHRRHRGATVDAGGWCADSRSRGAALCDTSREAARAAPGQIVARRVLRSAASGHPFPEAAMKRSTVSWAVAALFLLTAAAALTAQGQAAPPPNLPAEFTTQTGQRIRVTQVAGGLFHPVEPGVPRRAHHSGGRAQRQAARHPRRRAAAAAGVGSAAASGIATTACSSSPLHPRFAENRLVYLSYPKRDAKGTRWRCRAAASTARTLTDVKEIFVADAWETSGNMAGRLFFGPDGMLYVTVGDRDRICCNAEQRVRMGPMTTACA